jgi:3-isopropylmalate dehydratase small subunit
MSKSKLFIIVQEENSKGKEIFRRLDTDEIIPKERMHPVKRPPTMIHLDSIYDNPPIYIEKIKGFRDKANALLVGDKLGIGNDIYCSLAYYFVSKV